MQNDKSNQSLRLLIFSASLRKDSLNTRLVKLASTVVEKNGGRVDYADMKEFDCPSFDGDLEQKSGIPGGAAELNNRILSNDAFIISCPEYNGSMPGLI